MSGMRNNISPLISTLTHSKRDYMYVCPLMSPEMLKHRPPGSAMWYSKHWRHFDNRKRFLFYDLVLSVHNVVVNITTEVTAKFQRRYFTNNTDDIIALMNETRIQ